MARHKRIQIPGLLRHVMSRGNGRMRLFLDDADYRKFLFILGDMVDAFDIECWDFCLMPNHYHLALYPRRPNISRAIQALNGDYGTWWNKTHSMVGHVFQGRFKAQIVQREGYLRALCRYIARNPVRARLVDDPADWRWSSYAATAGLAANPGFLSSDPILNQFGDHEAGVVRELYQQHVLAPQWEGDVDDRLRSRERVLGDRSFKRQLLRDERAESASQRLVLPSRPDLQALRLLPL
jgi:REP element-mobilizing transposase RayT